jgi:hypothetical protein
MSTLTRNALIVNPTTPANPRESWPAWTDEFRWEPTPDTDEPRPTIGPDFLPSVEDLAEAVALLN